MPNATNAKDTPPRHPTSASSTINKNKTNNPNDLNKFGPIPAPKHANTIKNPDDNSNAIIPVCPDPANSPPNIKKSQ